MKIRIAQLVVSKDIDINRAKILDVLAEAEPGEWVIFPEALLSGYYPHEDIYTEGLDWGTLSEHLEEIQRVIADRKCRCLLGSAVFDGESWKNSVLIFGRDGGKSQHHKIELSALDRKHFSPGHEVAAHRVDEVTLGVVACRELLFPAYWSSLRAEGAKVIFHLNNAIQPKDGIWKHLLISRAIENSIYVVSVNNADHPQALASYVISPDGFLLQETALQTEQALTQTIDLGAVVDDLSSREDF